MSTRYCLCSEATLRDLETVLKPQLIAKSSMYPCDMTNAQWQVLAKHATHILAAEGDSQWVFFDGNYQEYEVQLYGPF